MSTIPSMNLFSSQLVANIKKPVGKQQHVSTFNANRAMNLRSNGKIKMSILESGSKKPCGRCGGSK